MDLSFSPDGRQIAFLYSAGAPKTPGPLNPLARDVLSSYDRLDWRHFINVHRDDNIIGRWEYFGRVIYDR